MTDVSDCLVGNWITRLMIVSVVHCPGKVPVHFVFCSGGPSSVVSRLFGCKMKKKILLICEALKHWQRVYFYTKTLILFQTTFVKYLCSHWPTGCWYEFVLWLRPLPWNYSDHGQPENVPAGNTHTYTHSSYSDVGVLFQRHTAFTKN